jgi:dolichol-phosphate mannosyltransferase
LRVVIVIPTYNESENVQALVPQVVKSCDGMRDVQIAILIVDDESPDGTAAAVRNMQSTIVDLHMISGKKTGLGAAYIRGMQFALASLAADVIFEMDADFSHNPLDVPRLLGALQAGADVVIGSRYVPGGSIPETWGLLRKMNSRVGNLVARWIAGLYPVHDCTAGFRAIRSDILRRVRLDRLGVQGYAFQVALLHELKVLGARIVEVPVEFVDRTRGESKLGLSDIVEFVINCWWIRFRSSATLIKFLLVGSTGVLVNLGSFAALLHVGLSKFAASPIAIEVSIVTNFLLNNFWTFRWRNVGASLFRRGVTFNVVSLGALAVSFGCFVISSFVAPSLPPLYLQLISIVPAFIVNYYGHSNVTFRRQRPE